jgi:hypothetical protein
LSVSCGGKGKPAAAGPGRAVENESLCEDFGSVACFELVQTRLWGCSLAASVGSTRKWEKRLMDRKRKSNGVVGLIAVTLLLAWVAAVIVYEIDIIFPAG